MTDNNDNRPVPLPPTTSSTTGSSSTFYDKWENEKYFGNYSKMRIHADMLGDKPRNFAYYTAIFNNRVCDFEGKVVLDVGCGTGILSSFCALAGARKVYAVEASDMWENAEMIFHRNGLSDRIQIFHSMVEDVELPEQVDIIVSEWMGCFLVFESMIESVLYARDAWLKEGGKMYPAIAQLYLSPLSYSTYFDYFKFTREPLHGVDLSHLFPFMEEEYLEHVLKCAAISSKNIIQCQRVDGAECKNSLSTPKSHVRSSSQLIKTMDMKTITSEEMKKTISSFSFEFKLSQEQEFHGFALWFDVIFTGSEGVEDVVLSTSPDEPQTHWRQDLLLFSPYSQLTEQHKEKVHRAEGVVRILQNQDWSRHWNFDLSFQFNKRPIYKQFIC